MKKITSLFCLAAFALAPTGVATAQESTTTEANVLQLTGAYGSSDTEYVLTVKLENSADVRDLCFDITVPEGLSVTGMGFADFSSAFSYNLKMNDAKTRAIMYSTTGSIFAANFGSPIVNITLNKAEGVNFEEKTIELNNIEISTSLLSATSLAQTDNTASYTVPAAVADVDGIVYAGTSEGQTKSLAEFLLIQETAPNAIMIVDGAYADDIQDVKNVVFEYANDGVKAYVCRELVLTDLKNFYTPVDFVAKSGSYTRTVATTSHNSTACFPFTLATTDLPAGYKILTFAYFQRIDGVEGDQGYVFFNTNSDIKAGVPCFLFNENPSDWDISFNNSTIVSTPENSGGLKGAFVETDYNQYQPCYRPSAGNDKLTTAKSDILPFRCVLSLNYDERFNGDEDANRQAPERLKMFIIDDEANGIETIKIDNDENLIYNINGQRLMNADKAGFYIINGKKVIKK